MHVHIAMYVIPAVGGHGPTPKRRRTEAPQLRRKLFVGSTEASPTVRVSVWNVVQVIKCMQMKGINYNIIITTIIHT